MQSYEAQDGSGDAFFDTIPFAKVFHEGGTGGDRSITHSRCAEVLAPSPLLVQNCLTSVYCRSEAERLTLLEDLGQHKTKWREHILVSDDLRVFDKFYTFVEDVALQKDGVVFKLHPPQKPETWVVRVEAWTHEQKQVLDSTYSIPAVPSNEKKAWRAPVDLQDGWYRVKIRIEGCRAFEARLLFGDIPF
jgi:hypothetical protein